MKHAHIDPNRPNHWTGHPLCCLLLLGLVKLASAETARTETAAAAPAQRTIDTQSRPDPRLVTVEELMRLDAQAALRLARGNQYEVLAPPVLHALASPQSIDAESLKPPAVPVVQAIYGIGRALTAEVQLGHEMHVLDQKTKSAARLAQGAIVLEKIEPPCVHLKKDQRIEVLCLKQVQP